MTIKKKRLYIHYGANHFEPSRFQTIKNYPYPYNKPEYRSGMWASPVKTKYGWIDWCLQEEFGLDKLGTSFRFTLKDGARVAHIRKPEDLYRILPICTKNDILFYFCIDFEVLAKKYDAMELHLTEDPSGVRGDLYYLLYGWDCDSILILNPDVVEEVL